jgi:hypothetical protein
VKLIVIAVMVFDALEEARFLASRMGRASGGWWREAEHRERRQLHEGEAGYLIRLLGGR